MTKRLLVLLVLAAFGIGACGSSGGGSSAASFCSLVKKDNSDLKNATNKDALAAIRELEQHAPSAIKADLKTLIDTIDSVTASSLPSAADAQKVEAASKNIEKYVKDECKIDLS